MNKLSTTRGGTMVVFLNRRFYLTKAGYYRNDKDGGERMLHRAVWVFHNGEIPEGYQIHHIDHDRGNNDISNLQLMLTADHAKLHNYGRTKEFMENWQKLGVEAAKEWAKTPEGKEYRKQHAKKVKLGTMTFGEAECEQCGCTFTKKTTRTRFCQTKCWDEWRHENKEDVEIVKCKTCDSEYERKKYTARKYCSKECRPVPNSYKAKHSKPSDE